MHDDLGRLLSELGADGRLVHLERLAARAERTGTPAQPLPDGLLARAGVGALWSHQARAIDAVRAGTSVVVATGTASGKSLCYQLPIAEAVQSSPPGTALALFPTKALAHDQLRALHALDVPGLVAATYDGDATPEARTWVRRHASVVLTNPEMLHGGILPMHGRWATFLRRLRYVVVDELHVFRGIFGSHLAHVLRRLRRLCAAYGSSPTFVFGSATIGDPAGLASALCGLPVQAITDDGSPRGERTFALWNPPLVDERSGARASSHVEAARVAAALLAEGRRTLVFCRSRRGTELVAEAIRRRLGSPRAELVRSYRSGYLSEERRAIEADLAAGRLLGVVATSALELGVDIGGVDACVLDGFPGTIASMWQQAGRAGREHQPAAAVLVAGSDLLDQWLMAHPREVFRRPPEPAVVTLSNPYVLHPHLACAAYEAPLAPPDAAWWGHDLDEAVRDLAQGGRLRVREGRAFWAGRGSPAPGLGLRGGGGDEVRIADLDGRLVGTVDQARAPEVVHPGAVYLHQGQAYRVEHLDLHEGEAVVQPVGGEEYTQVRSTTDVRVLGVERRAPVGPLHLHLGPVEVSSQVDGYERRDARTSRVLGRHPLDLPPQRLVTRAFWYTLPGEVLEEAGVPPGAVAGTLHALEHAAIGILPLFTICDRWDVGGVSTAMLADTGAPTIVVYDGYPGGAGIAEQGFAAGRRHLEATLAVVERCGCRSGCPSCVQSPKCGNGNDPLDKAGAVALLRLVLGHTSRVRPHRSGSRRMVADAARTASPRKAPTRGMSVGER